MSDPVSAATQPLASSAAVSSGSPPGDTGAREAALRALVSAAAVVAVIALGFVPAPGLDRDLLQAFAEDWQMPRLSIVHLGLAPVVTGILIVELLALAIPSWRLLRTGGFAARAVLERRALGVGVLVAMVQTGTTWRWLASFNVAGNQIIEPSAAPSLLAALLAGPFLLVALARLVDARGLGGGYAVLLVGVTIPALGEPLVDFVRALDGDPTARKSVLPLAVGLALVIMAVLRAPLARAGAAPGRALAPPTSGLLPVLATPWLLTLPATLEPFWGPTGWAHELVAGTLAFTAGDALIVAALTPLYAWLFARPALLARAWARAEGGEEVALRPAAERAWRGALLPSLGVGAAFVAGTALVARAGHGPDLVVLAYAVALASDVVAEWRARERLGPLLPVRPLHRAYDVAPARALLEREGIPSFARGLTYRVVHQFFAPYAPITLFVSAQHAAQAVRVLDDRYGA